MIRSVELPLHTHRERNERVHWRVLAKRVALQRATLREALAEHFLPPPLHIPSEQGGLTANRITVTMTRLSPALLDSDGPADALKNVRDEIAAWIGCDDSHRSPIVWEARQEKRRGPIGLRIELEDLAPGEPRRVQLATIEPFIARAKADIKAREKAKMYTGTKRGGTQVYHAAEGQQAASSAARSKAEAAFAKVTGKAPKTRAVLDAKAIEGLPPTLRELAPAAFERHPVPKPRASKAAPAGSEDATPRMLVDCPTCGAKRGIVCTTVGALVSGVHVERARLAGLASAAARVLPPTKPTGPRKPAVKVPEDVAAMRAQARSVACPVCPAVNVTAVVPASGGECIDVPNNPEPFEYGVHVARARAAGLPPFPCAADLDAGARPVRVPCGCDDGKVPDRRDVKPGVERVVCGDCNGTKWGPWTWLPGRGAEVWLHLEGEPKPYRREPKLEGDSAPPDVVQVTLSRGPVTLRREVFTTRANRLAWMFRTEKRG